MLKTKPPKARPTKFIADGFFLGVEAYIAGKRDLNTAGFDVENIGTASDGAIIVRITRAIEITDFEDVAALCMNLVNNCDGCLTD
jgi:hypothetical protein